MKNIFIVFLLAFTFLSISGCCSKKSNLKSHDKMYLIYDPQPMHEIFRSGVLDTLSCPCKNEMAIIEYKQRIAMLKTALTPGSFNNDLLNDVIFAINNFELVTGIKSEADGNFFGRWMPTLKDVEFWSDWLQLNKEYLCIDSNYNIIYKRR